MDRHTDSYLGWSPTTPLLPRHNLVPPLISGGGFPLSWIWTAWWLVLTNRKVVEMSLWTSRPCPEEDWRVASLFSGHLAAMQSMSKLSCWGERPERERETFKDEASHGEWGHMEEKSDASLLQGPRHVRRLLGPPPLAQPPTECKTTESHSRPWEAEGPNQPRASTMRKENHCCLNPGFFEGWFFMI